MGLGVQLGSITPAQPAGGLGLILSITEKGKVFLSAPKKALFVKALGLFPDADCLGLLMIHFASQGHWILCAGEFTSSFCLWFHA